MIGQILTDDKGLPIDNGGRKLDVSSYQPPQIIKDLFRKVQTDYQVNWSLQHRSFREFDGLSLLQRTNLDQETVSAYVGGEFVEKGQRWRWKGRKNTARNKIIGILARLIAGMLYPYVDARNEKNEADEMTARVMRILVEDHLKKAGYEMKYMYMAMTALTNPAVIVEVEWVQALQRIKKKMNDGSYKVIEAVDEILSGLNLHIVPIDEFLIGDFYTGAIQAQPNILRVRRISYEQARKMYEGKFYDEYGKDLFGYVQAGMTRIFMAGQDYQTLFDVEWTEADRGFVQLITASYRDDDLEVEFLGGVFMGNMKDPYNSNPFKHRRFTLLNGAWESVPVYQYAKSGFEPIDPTGRFFYYKSAAFKQYWDDATLNKMTRNLVDAASLETIKPYFLSGVTKLDKTIMFPGATIGMPPGAQVTPYSSSPNTSLALQVIQKQDDDMQDSTADNTMNGQTTPGVTATQTNIATQQAKVFLGLSALMMSDLIRQVGELTMDCIIGHATVGELDMTVPDSMKLKYQTFLAKGKDKGKNVTHKIVFTDTLMGKQMTQAQKTDKEWRLYDRAGGYDSDQRLYMVNPYQFARYTYTLGIDPDQIVLKSSGTDRQQKMLAFQMLSDPRVLQYTDQEAVVDDFVIDEFADGDPDRYKKKGPATQAGAPPMNPMQNTAPVNINAPASMV